MCSRYALKLDFVVTSCERTGPLRSKQAQSTPLPIAPGAMFAPTWGRDSEVPVQASLHPGLVNGRLGSGVMPKWLQPWRQ